MESKGIEKALQELAEALKNNDTVARVKVEITLVKPKPSKANPESKQLSQAESGRRAAPLIRPIIAQIYEQFKCAEQIGGVIVEIIKGDTVYRVSESSNKWTAKRDSGKLSVSFDVSKELCITEQELREYVLSNDELF